MVKTTPLIIFFLLLSLLSLFNIWRRFFAVPALGDGVVIALVMSNAAIFPSAKYLVGMGVLRAIYSVIGHVPGLLQMLPADAPAQIGFIRVIGIIATLATSLILLKAGKGSLRVVLALTTPIWLLFSIGYVEYYPSIAGLFLAFLYGIFSRPLAALPALLVGIAVGVLPLVYAGFAPYALIALAFYLFSAGWQQRFVVMATAGGAFLLAILLFWDAGVVGFFQGLIKDLNLGESNTVYEAYQGLSASPRSIFFSPAYVLSMQHLRDVLLMVFSGLGIAGICALPLLIWLLRPALALSHQDLLALCMAGWSIAYLLLMMPKLGPVQDLDLFFASYITLAFVFGMKAETCRWMPRPVLLVVWFASSAFSMAYICKWLLAPALPA